MVQVGQVVNDDTYYRGVFPVFCVLLCKVTFCAISLCKSQPYVAFSQRNGGDRGGRIPRHVARYVGSGLDGIVSTENGSSD